MYRNYTHNILWTQNILTYSESIRRVLSESVRILKVQTLRLFNASKKSSRIQETLNLLKCTDSSRNTIFCLYRVRNCYLGVMCHKSGVASHVSRFTCHMSLSPTATADLDLDPSTMSRKEPKMNFFPPGDFQKKFNQNCKL